MTGQLIDLALVGVIPQKANKEVKYFFWSGDNCISNRLNNTVWHYVWLLLSRIDDANFKGTIWTFKQWPAIKMSYFSPNNVLI